MSWTAQGTEQAWGCVLKDSRALARATLWPGPGLEAAVTLSPHPYLSDLDLVAVAVYLDAICGTWPLPLGRAEEPEGQLGPGHLTPLY